MAIRRDKAVPPQTRIERNAQKKAEYILENIMHRRNWTYETRDQLRDALHNFAIDEVRRATEIRELNKRVNSAINYDRYLIKRRLQYVARADDLGTMKDRLKAEVRKLGEKR